MALWTDEQVANLRARQAAEWCHPYTCGACPSDLVPTPDGWACVDCGYRQTFALEDDLDGYFPPDPFARKE